MNDKTYETELERAHAAARNPEENANDCQMALIYASERIAQLEAQPSAVSEADYVRGYKVLKREAGKTGYPNITDFVKAVDATLQQGREGE